MFSENLRLYQYSNCFGRQSLRDFQAQFAECTTPLNLWRRTAFIVYHGNYESLMLIADIN
jgi:hypothetical protein